MLYINKSYRRTGTLWDSHYKSSLIEADAYLLHCQRYIELNPVHADMVADPAQYRWSSYRSNAPGEPDSRLKPHPVFLALGAAEPIRQQAYRALFRPHLDKSALDDIRLAINQNQPLGSERFLAQIEQFTGMRREAKRRGRPVKDKQTGEMKRGSQENLGF